MDFSQNTIQFSMCHTTNISDIRYFIHKIHISMCTIVGNMPAWQGVKFMCNIAYPVRMRIHSIWMLWCKAEGYTGCVYICCRFCTLIYKKFTSLVMFDVRVCNMLGIKLTAHMCETFSIKMCDISNVVQQVYFTVMEHV